MDYQLTIDRILEHANRVYPHKQVITRLADGIAHRYTYADLYRRVQRLANVLKRLGIVLGDRIGTFAWNRYQHLELYYAVPCYGAVIHTLNVRLAPSQLAEIIQHAGDCTIFIDGALLPAFEPVTSCVKGVQHYVSFNTAEGTGFGLDYEGLMADADEVYDGSVTDEKLAMGLCYTTGTTGKPKGVRYSHRSTYLHALAINQANVFGLTEADRVLPVVPMYHAMAWGLPYACAFAGADIVLPGTDTSPETLSNLIQSERVTVAAAVPTVWANVYHELQRNPRDISSLRAIITGGSAPPVWLIEAYEKELGVEVIHAWGMTEMSPTGTVSRLQTRHKYLTQQAQWKLKAKQGTPVPGVALRVVEASGREVPRDGTTMGEVQVRGMSVVGEYEKEDNDNNTFTPDGWLRTGDVATIDADGYMQLTDRAKDLIKSGGEWVSSVALENALTSHANVSEAAVIAVADETWGERPVALVVPIQANDPPTQDELLAHMAPGFPKFWLPNKIILVDALPKTSVGKLDKQALRKRYG